VTIEVRPVARADWPSLFEVMRELRTRLSLEEFLARAARQAEAHRYELWGARVEGEGGWVGAMGLRPLETLARGAHIHVDDLVVADRARKLGAGRLLMERAFEIARERGCAAVFLDSRVEAVGFYERLAFEGHPAKIMKRKV
jgi:GNAT superfamily N-acetyltransferase